MTSQEEPQKTSSQEQGGKPIREGIERTYEHEAERERSRDDQETTSSPQQGQSGKKASQEEDTT